MRWWHGLAATSLLLAGAAQAQTTTDAGSAGTFAFVDVDVLPMDRDVRLSSQTVVSSSAMAASPRSAPSTTSKCRTMRRASTAQAEC